jgi:hypothetical protein
VSAQELAAGLFRALDTNADGRLDQVEFQPLGATLDAAPTPAVPADSTLQAEPLAPPQS